MAGNFRSFNNSSQQNRRGGRGGRYNNNNRQPEPDKKLVFNTTQHFFVYGDNDCKKHINSFIERAMDKYIYNCPKGYENPNEPDEEFKKRCDDVCAKLVRKYRPCSNPTQECSRLGQEGYEEHEKCEWLRQNDYNVYFPNGEPPKLIAPKMNEECFPFFN